MLLHVCSHGSCSLESENREFSINSHTHQHLLSFCGEFYLFFINLYLSTMHVTEIKHILFIECQRKSELHYFYPRSGISIGNCAFCFLKFFFVLFLLLKFMQCTVTTFPYSVILIPLPQLVTHLLFTTSSTSASIFSLSLLLSCACVCMGGGRAYFAHPVQLLLCVIAIMCP